MDMIESMRRIGLKPQEVLAVRDGIKPMLRTSTNESGIKEIEKFCRENKLYCIITPFDAPPGIKLDKQIYTVFISKSEEKAKEFCEIEKGLGREFNNNIIKAGELLGYPRCCEDYYIGLHKRHKDLDKKDTSFMIQSLESSKNKPSFYLNNIFNFDSRATPEPNMKLKGTLTYFLISHVPCSYNCEKSIEYAKKVLEILKREAPEFTKQILHHIRRPILFYDDLNWVVFDGEVKGNEIHYREIILHYLDSKELLEKLKSGNVVKADEKRPETGIIFDFG